MRTRGEGVLRSHSISLQPLDEALLLQILHVCICTQPVNLCKWHLNLLVCDGRVLAVPSGHYSKKKQLIARQCCQTCFFIWTLCCRIYNHLCQCKYLLCKSTTCARQCEIGKCCGWPSCSVLVCGCGPHTVPLDLGSVCVVLTPHFIEISVFTAVVGAHNSM